MKLLIPLLFAITLVLATLVTPALAKTDLKLEVEKLDASQFPKIHLFARLKDPLGRSLPIFEQKQVFLHEEAGSEANDIKQFQMSPGRPGDQNRLAMLCVMDLRAGRDPFLDMMRQAGKRLIELSHPQDYPGLGQIHASPDFELSEKFLKKEAPKKGQKKSKREQQLLSALDHLNSDTDQPGFVLWDGVMDALSELEKVPAARRVIFLFTDGQSSEEAVKFKEIYEKAQNLHIQIHVLGLGDPRLHQNLDRLADLTGGQYTPLLKLEDARKLAEFHYAKAVNSYALRKPEEIIYTSPLQGVSAAHQLRIRVQPTEDEMLENRKQFTPVIAKPWFYSPLWLLSVLGGLFCLGMGVFMLRSQRQQGRTTDQDLSPTPPTQPPHADGLTGKTSKTGKSGKTKVTRVNDSTVVNPILTQSVLEVVEGASAQLPKGHTFALQNRKMLIGRNGQCDIVLKDSYIGRQHASLIPRQGSYAIEPLGEGHEVLVNQALVQQSQLLQDGDMVQIGDVRLRFKARAGRV